MAEGLGSIYFPKKSHHGYFDKNLQMYFHSKEHKRQVFKEKGLREGDSASQEHINRVKDFVGWVHDEKRKNPNFERTEAYRKERYPN